MTTWPCLEKTLASKPLQGLCEILHFDKLHLMHKIQILMPLLPFTNTKYNSHHSIWVSKWGKNKRPYENHTSSLCYHLSSFPVLVKLQSATWRSLRHWSLDRVQSLQILFKSERAKWSTAVLTEKKNLCPSFTFDERLENNHKCTWL